MKNNSYNTSLNQKLAGIFIVCFLVISVSCQAYSRDFYQIKIYTLENEQQELRMDKYLKDAFIPALHRAGISKVGVFKPVADDNMAGKLIYVFVPFKSMDQFEKLGAVLMNDKKYLKKGSDYIDAAHDNGARAMLAALLSPCMPLAIILFMRASTLVSS